MRSSKKEKGVVLLITLGIVLVVIILADVILNIISSQSRLTHHQVSRIQAYYAAQAGMNVAIENLRTGTWAYPADCPKTAPCSVTDTDFPGSIRSVSVILCPANSRCPQDTSSVCNPPTGYNFCITTTVDYTYITAP